MPSHLVPPAFFFHWHCLSLFHVKNKKEDEEITDEDREAIALAREDVKNGNWIDGKELFETIRKKYASK